MQTVMSALSLLVVRSHPAARRVRHVTGVVPRVAPQNAARAIREKESYFEMARYLRWKQ